MFSYRLGILLPVCLLNISCLSFILWEIKTSKKYQHFPGIETKLNTFLFFGVFLEGAGDARGDAAMVFWWNKKSKSWDKK